MYRFVRLGLAAWMSLFTFVLGAPSSAAAAAPTICTADLTIFTTTPGMITSDGQTIHVRESGVAGKYMSDFLAGYTFEGSQNFVVNNTTRKSQLHGSFIATGPEGTLTIRYTGHADLTTGAATGRFVSADGTGKFTNFHWQGSITAQLISLTPPTFIATDSGPCHTTP